MGTDGDGRGGRGQVGISGEGQGGTGLCGDRWGRGGMGGDGRGRSAYLWTGECMHSCTTILCGGARLMMQ